MNRIALQLLFLAILIVAPFPIVRSQGVRFSGDFSPGEGLVTPQEKPCRDEICLNGYWEVQIKPLPASWKEGSGIAPGLPAPDATQWETVKIKIPSPINVNNWGNGSRVGEGTDLPYAPSSVYFTSYPEQWNHARMAWLRRSFTVPENWKGKRLILHFEAVAGEAVLKINGKEVAHHFDSHLPFEADITDFVKADAFNELLLGLRHTRLFDQKHPDYKFFGATYPTGSNTDDLIGIWQDVFLLAVPEVRISDVFVKPLVSQNALVLDITIENTTGKEVKISLDGNVKQWINKAGKDILSAPVPHWELAQGVSLPVPEKKLQAKPGITQTVIQIPVKPGDLDYWTPETPNLYGLTLSLSCTANRAPCTDIKYTRFGWREFTIAGDEFHLNGKKIQCFGDIQHPFSAYVCSRRFAYAWYQMIKDFGGNAVRPHAQPWSRVYYDLADEMGLMVLDETALFGSSIRLNLEEAVTWQRSKEHLKRLILRDRNHPSVIGWSAGNEMFAIALLNKPEKEVAARWDDQLVDLALSAKQTDDTRPFITLDGDRDMDGRLPVWSKHFAHGLKLEDLPKDLNKPLIVGESGATYYGRPIQLYPFVGDKAFQSYDGRSEALAIDVYQNVKQMALPYLAYYSPSEVSWFGIEHLNLGYHDYSRLPGLQDGIFPGKLYEEGKPGYQYERIPPYVSTFNPGLDPELPLYHSLPMFEALQAALTGKPLRFGREITAQPALPKISYEQAGFVGDTGGELYRKLTQLGVNFSQNSKSALWIVDAENVSEAQMQKARTAIDAIKKAGGMVWLMLADRQPSAAAQALLPLPLSVTNRIATSLDNNRATAWGDYFQAPDLYFAEAQGDRQILKQGLSGELVEKGKTVLTACNVDWSLFNEQPENRKCAQVVLYEHLEKPAGAALVTYPLGKATLVVSTMDYRPDAPEYIRFWHNLLSVMEVKWDKNDNQFNKADKKEHDLLLDGPVD